MDEQNMDRRQNSLSDDEIKHLREMSQYWSAGKIVVSMIIVLGALAVAAVHMWDFIAKVTK